MANQLGLPPALAESSLNGLVSALRSRNTLRSTEHLCGLSAQLLASLVNPQNVSLLASELLISTALWQRATAQEPTLQVCHRLINVFAYAAHRRRIAPAPSSPIDRHLSPMAFTKAIAQALNDQWSHAPHPDLPPPSRYKDLMVLAGLLLGYGNRKNEPPAPIDPGYLHRRLLAPSLQIAHEYVANHFQPPEWQSAITLALTVFLPTLPDGYQPPIPADGFLVMASQALGGPDGLDGGRVLGTVDGGVTQVGHFLDWSGSSPSFLQFQKHEQRPFVSNMAALAKVMGYAIRTAKDAGVVHQVLDDLVSLSGSMLQHWQGNKLCAVDLTAEAMALTSNTLGSTWPALWSFLRRTLYSATAILEEIISRALVDRGLGAQESGVMVATKSLATLRNLSFISSYKGADAFEAYSYVRLAALDKLAKSPLAIANFLESIKPPSSPFAAGPVQAAMDYFYLTTAEHLPLNMEPMLRESLIVGPAAVYLKPFDPSSLRMRQLFEAANAAILAVISCPGNESVTVPLVPFYIDTLLQAFPARMSPRQFRLAFKTLVKVLSPPNPLFSSHYRLCETVMELAHQRVHTAADEVLPAGPGEDSNLAFSEKSTLVLAMADALPFLPDLYFEDWLTTTAIALNAIPRGPMHQMVRQRFFNLATGGELDPWQTPVFLAWWTAKGGNEAVLAGNGPLLLAEPLMSGAILTGQAGSTQSHI